MLTEPSQNDITFIKEIERRLNKIRLTANWLAGALILLGTIAIASSLFITAFAGNVEILAIKIISFSGTLCLTLIAAFRLASKASCVRNGWKHLNKAVISFKANTIDRDTLIKAYEESENMLGVIDFNFTKEASKEIT